MLIEAHDPELGDALFESRRVAGDHDFECFEVVGCRESWIASVTSE